MSLIYTLLAAAAGGLLVKKLKMPAGAMVGAMAAVALLGIFTGQAFLPPEIKVVLQIIAGTFIGIGVEKKDVVALKRIIRPAAINIAAVIVLTLIMGFLLYFFTGFDLPTALLSCAPGGVVDMALISYDMGADASVVSILQLARLVSIIVLFPPLIAWLVKHFGKKKAEVQEQAPEPEVEDVALDKVSGKCRIKSILVTCLVGTASGLVGYFLKIPAGTIVFSMAGVAALNIFWGKAYLPNPLRTGAQICSGGLIGEGITLAALIGLKDAVVPALLFVLGHFLISILLSIRLYRSSKMNLATCFFCCASGGMQEFSLIAPDFGADASKVMTFQLLRIVCVIGLYPTLISGLLMIFPNL